MTNRARQAKFCFGVLVERQRAYGRRLCEGVASFAYECQEVSLGMLEWSDLDDSKALYLTDVKS